jgi:hypothetical protein
MDICDKCGRNDDEISIFVTEDPYQADRYDNHELCFMCDDCYKNALGDI